VIIEQPFESAQSPRKVSERTVEDPKRPVTIRGEPSMNTGRFEDSARSAKWADHQWHARGQGFRSPQLHHQNPPQNAGFILARRIVSSTRLVVGGGADGDAVVGGPGRCSVVTIRLVCGKSLGPPSDPPRSRPSVEQSTLGLQNTARSLTEGEGPGSQPSITSRWISQRP
jgi:hypothetical protein